MTNIVDIKNLNVHYDSVFALSDINLAISKNEFLGIIGPNGGGKSTLLKTILGLINPSSGKVTILGKTPLEASKSLSFVPQFSKFDKKFPISVKEVVSMGCLTNKIKLFHHYTVGDKKNITSILKLLDIYHLKDRQIGELSGGQLQRVLIARALTTNPKLLLLDEPTSSLDSKSKSQIFNLLKELNKKMTIIMVTHDMSAISSYVTSIACLNKHLYYHGKAELNEDIVQRTFGCPIDLIAHGVPHRVLKNHEGDSYNA